MESKVMISIHVLNPERVKGYYEKIKLLPCINDYVQFDMKAVDPIAAYLMAERGVPLDIVASFNGEGIDPLLNYGFDPDELDGFVDALDTGSMADKVNSKYLVGFEVGAKVRETLFGTSGDYDY